MRVPVERLDEALDALRGLGRVTDERVTTTDVTAQTRDVAARLTALRTQETRLLQLLRGAETVRDVIDIEDRLGEVRAEIERLEASQRGLAERVATALISVRLQLPARFLSEPPYGSISIAAADPAGAAGSLRERVEALGGYVSDTREYQRNSEYTVE